MNWKGHRFRWTRPYVSKKSPASTPLVTITGRKSTEEGLEQEFNSLQAQREACEAFINSQRHGGRVCLRAAYDDGGFSGATIERPALQRLLADIAAGRVDTVPVTRSDGVGAEYDSVWAHLLECHADDGEGLRY